MQVRDGHTKSCLTCGKSKQKCVGATWEGGEGASGDGSGTLVVELGGVTELLWELVEGQKDLVAEVRSLGEVLVWGWDPLRDAEEYSEWLEEFDEEEFAAEVVGLEEENALFREFLRSMAEKEGDKDGEMEMEIE